MMNPDKSGLPRLYQDLAEWWPVLSAPGDYAEEALFYHRVLQEACDQPPRTLLELGCGGGNNASHLKRYYQMTLVDLSPGMLAVSQQLNPECEHIQGDMRGVRLERLFDAVFIHDAISYLLTEEDLTLTFRTAFMHCRPGGAAVFCPDATTETFHPHTAHGGHDLGNRSLRYLEWFYDPDQGDTACMLEMVYLLHEENKPSRCIYDRHTQGLFPRSTWMALIAAAGFFPKAIPFSHSEINDDEAPPVFIGNKPA